MLVRHFISLDKNSKYCNVNYIHKYGLSEVERITKEMESTKDKSGFKGSLKEFNDHLKSRKDLKFKNPESILKYYRKMQSHINNNIIKKHFNPDDARELWHITNQQDWKICEKVQRGMNSVGFEQGYYAEMEDENLDVKKYILDKLSIQI